MSDYNRCRMAGCAVLPISLFIFAWTSYEDVSWVGPMMSGIPFGWSMVSIYVRLLLHHSHSLSI